MLELACDGEQDLLEELFARIGAEGPAGNSAVPGG
jgi:hypothetical protein